MGERESKPGLKCCLCGDPVTPAGYCEGCQRWPINAQPKRWDERGHLVGPDGFCLPCMAFTMTEMLGQAGEWVDTRRVPKLLSREENRRRMGEMAKILEAGILKAQLPREQRDMEAEKRRLFEAHPPEDDGEVPF